MGHTVLLSLMEQIKVVSKGLQSARHRNRHS